MYVAYTGGYTELYYIFHIKFKLLNFSHSKEHKNFNIKRTIKIVFLVSRESIGQIGIRPRPHEAIFFQKNLERVIDLSEFNISVLTLFS